MKFMLVSLFLFLFFSVLANQSQNLWKQRGTSKLRQQLPASLGGINAITAPKKQIILVHRYQEIHKDSFFRGNKSIKDPRFSDYDYRQKGHSTIREENFLFSLLISHITFRKKLT